MFVFLLSFTLSTVEEDIEMYANTEFDPPLHLGSKLSNRKALGDTIDVDAIQKILSSRRIAVTESDLFTRKPFRLIFDYDDAVSGADNFQCKYVGQEIAWSLNPQYTCKEEDILTDQKRESLIQTLKNVEKFISKFLKIRHSKMTLTPYFYGVDNYFNPPKKEFDVDHYVVVSVRSFSGFTIAGSLVTAHDNKTLRPLQSSIFINPRYIPSVPQDFDSIPRNYFNTLFHECMHSLGLINDDYYLWFDKRTGKTYDAKSFINYFHVDKYNKTFLQLCSPKATEVAQKLLKRKTNWAGIKQCLEMEDNGGPGTIYSHPKATIFRQDLMTGTAPIDGKLSPVLCALMDDIGFYTVNWNVCERLSWIDSYFYTDKEIHKMSEKPARSAFPASHYYKPNSSFLAHDLRGYTAWVDIKKYDTEKDEKDIIRYKDLYIPEDKIIGSTATYDYSLIKNPKITCLKNQWAMAVYNGTGVMGMCSESSLGKNGVFTFKDLNGTTHTCKKSQEVKVGDYIYYCPDTDLIKKVIDFQKKLGAPFRGNLMMGDKIFIIVVSCVLVTLIIVAMVFAYCIYMKKNKTNPSAILELSDNKAPLV